VVVTSQASDSVQSEIIIRQGRLGDLRAVLAIEQAAFGRHALDPSTLFWLLLRRWPGFIIAESARHVAGYVITRIPAFPHSPKYGGISSIAVHSPYFRRGIGRKLMLAALDFLRNSDVDIIELEVNVKNEPAKSLYKSLGFTDEKLLPDYYGHNEDGMRMTLVFEKK
jgi:[ribosomal protein S18]-alanine N-acetyltransferase